MDNLHVVPCMVLLIVSVIEKLLLFAAVNCNPRYFTC
ncbi:hypothetical protein SOVF_105410 [Spinacia oleracea]|nr:hypothetical protein SOVF_105410 [Spinacia oleracea]